MASVINLVDFRYLQPLLVHRENPNSRRLVSTEIQRRVDSGQLWNNIWIFPQGTTSNSQCITSFCYGSHWFRCTDILCSPWKHQGLAVTDQKFHLSFVIADSRRHCRTLTKTYFISNFSLGAFTPGREVQPVRIEIGRKSDIIDWTSYGSPTWKALLMGFLRLYKFFCSINF